MKKINFSNNLKNLREHHNLTQSKLSVLLDVTRQSIYAYEQGKATPSLEVLDKMTDIFNCSLDSLIFESTPLNISKFVSLNKSLDEDYTNFSTLNKLKDIKSQLINKKYLIDNSLEDINNAIHILEKTYASDTNKTTIENPDCKDHSLKKNTIEKNKINLDRMFNIIHSDFENYVEPKLRDKRAEQLLDLNSFDFNEVDYTEIPYICDISAGLPALAYNYCDDMIKIPDDYINSNHDYFILKVKGTSMNEIYNNKESLLIRRCSSVENGEIAVISVDKDNATLKEYRLDPKTRTVYLIPHSSFKEHEMQSYNIDEHNIEILGKVEKILKF